jgi:uncharacterized protein
VCRNIKIFATFSEQSIYNYLKEINIIMIKKNLLLFLTILTLTLVVILGVNKLSYSKSISESLTPFINVNNLQESDEKTRNFIREIVNPDMYSEPNFSALSCQDLKDIDKEWLLISKNKFGFTPQYKIWKQIKKIEKNPEKQVKMLGDKLGWTRKKPLTEEEYISPDWLYSDELNYSLKAPVGHLPWVGINGEIIRQMIVDSGPGCGSCTIDAMNLQNDRFYRYIPPLFKRFEQCKI